MDLETKKKIEDIVGKVSERKLSPKMAVDQICQLMDSYADRAVISFLELENQSRKRTTNE